MGYINSKFKHFSRVIVLAICLSLGFSLLPANSAFAASSSVKESFRQELREMLYSGDLSVHDIYKYRLTKSEMKEVAASVQYDEVDQWMWVSYLPSMYVNYESKGGYISKIWFEDTDDKAVDRYPRLKAAVDRIKAGLEAGMSDLDKLIYFHDAVVEQTSYKYVDKASYGECGILADGVGVCAGYTQTLNMFLVDQDIACYYISCPDINHGWTSVYIDGEWYHVDSTWDDTRSGKSGVTGHKFLLRNDAEFTASGSNSHAGTWKPYYGPDEVIKSTSTRFTSWYVHDITGKMAYENGYWYYVDTKTNSIIENTAEGGKKRVVLDGSGMSTITLIDATDAGISYKVSGSVKTVTYSGVNSDTPGDKGNDTIAPEVTGVEVTYYVMKYGSTSYTNIGVGYIDSASTSKNADVVRSKIVSIPDLSKVVAADEMVEWTAITKSGEGRYFVKGAVVKKPVTETPEPETPIEEEPTPEETVEEPAPVVKEPIKEETAPEPAPAPVVTEPEVPAPEPVISDDESSDVVAGVEAYYYIMKYGASTYTNVGAGTISVASTSKKSDVVASRIVSMPDMSSVCGADEKIEWTAITKSGSGKFFVKGTVVKK